MTDSAERKTAASSASGPLDLTSKLRSLQIPDAELTELDDYLANRRKALLICRDVEINKWGRRWLEREGLDVAVTGDADNCITTIETVQPHVIVIEGGLTDARNKALFVTLSQLEEVDAPIIVLATSGKDLGLALEANIYDIVRKPYEWKLVGRRAGMAARFGELAEELDKARAKLGEALDVAEGARVRLRSSESFEPVTGLPNKRKFVDLLVRGMTAAERDESTMAVFVVGFNRFRLVIEALGQENADSVLNEIAQRLMNCVENIDLYQTNTKGLRTSAAASIDAARFALMMTCAGDEDELVALQQELVDQLSRPVHVSGQTVYLSACVGASLYPQDASDADSLLQRADNAMREAQSRGGGFKFYCAETDAAAARKLTLENLLHEALNGNELTLAYQPLLHTDSGRLAGAEALLRWTQADGTAISPAEFVPVAEESGLMIRVGEYVLELACRQLREWLDNGIKVPHVCVNVSKAQLMHGGFVDLLARMIEKYALKPRYLELELSERGVLSGDFDVVSQLHEIKALGVLLSIDDFGTGDSAIAYLRELPVDVLKIDRSYVAGLPDNQKDKAIISAMIALGHSLDLRVVAEGVETRQQVDVLRELGCDELQGFYISPAVDALVFPKLLKDDPSDA